MPRPSRRKLAAAAVAIALAAGLTFSAAPAFAADDTTPNPGGWSEYKFTEYIKKMTQPMDPTKPRKFYPLTPSASKFREFMINTLGSVLGAAAPGAWQAEQMANKHRYDHSWEKFEQDFNTKSAGAAPQSYADYVLGKKDWKSKNADKVPKGGSAPATKASPFRRGVNGVGTAALALTAMPIGFGFGNGIADIFGFSASEGEVCGLGDNPLGIAAGMISGVDCDAYKMTVEAQNQANMDQAPQFVSTTSCSGGVCVTVNKIVSFVFVQGVPSYRSACAAGSGLGAGGTYAVTIKFDDGTTIDMQLLQGESYSPPRNFAEACGSSSKYFDYSRSNGSTPKQGTHFRVKVAGQPVPEFKEVQTERGDPERTLQCSITGTNGATYSMLGDVPYKESSGKIAAPDCPTLPEGVVPQNVSINDGQGNKIYDQPTTQPYRDVTTASPDCVDGSCPLDLLIYTTDKTSIASCFDLGAGCDGWMEAPDRDTRFECRYGGKKVALKDCYVYAAVFNESRQTVGAPYSDPATGVWTGGQSSPTAASQSMNQPVQDPNQSRKCLEKGWAQANPVEWVLVPVKCALEWAAVPRPTVVMKTQVDIKSSWEGTAFGKVGTLTAPLANIPIHSGCSGLPIKANFSWPKPWQIDWQLGAACDGPLAIAAGVTKTVAGGLIIVGGLLALSSYMGWSIGFRGFGRER